MPLLLEPLDGEELQQVAEAVDSAPSLVPDRAVNHADGLVIPDAPHIRRGGNPAIVRSDFQSPQKANRCLREVLERQLSVTVRIQNTR
jgi:hypothetical protein